MNLPSVILRVRDCWFRWSSAAGVLPAAAWATALRLGKALPSLRKQDWAILAITFGMAALLDVTVALVATIVLAALLLMKRNAEALASPGADREPSAESDRQRSAVRAVPHGVEVFQVENMLFLARAGPAWKALSLSQAAPKVFILAARETRPIDRPAFEALVALRTECDRRGIRFIVCGVRMPDGSPYGAADDLEVAGSIDEAIARARTLLSLPAAAHDPGGQGAAGGDET